MRSMIQGVAVADGDGVFEILFIFAKGIEVHSDAIRRSLLVMAAVAAADGSTVVVENRHLLPQRNLDLPVDAHLLLVLLEHRENADFDWRH